MNRAQFEHAIRAAAAVAGEREVIVIGSQAIHAWMENDVPEAAMRSAEADVALRDDVDGSKADLIDGSIGEASLFRALLHAGVVQRDTLAELIGDTDAQAARTHMARELLAPRVP